jgi:NAD+--asparagine ADP-ribosyltransferase
MKIDRDSIAKISKENKLVSISELLRYIDYADYVDSVCEKSKELENGIMKFRHNDRMEILSEYKKELYESMIKEGRILNKEKCGISE